MKWPDLDIVIIDKKTQFDYWVGEATVPPWADYVIRHCGLGPYLWKNHMLKHGVRFFFDSEKKDLPLWELSEFGRREYAPIPSFQIDRAVFDRDLCAMNREIGIEVRLGTALAAKGTDSAIALDAKGGHVVRTTGGVIRCRWLVDASGMRAVMARQLGILRPDWKRLRTSSYWSRFAGTQNMDRMGDEEWRRRVGFTERNLSSNSYMYRGYWLWQIPVSEKVVSLGVCLDDAMTPLVLKNATELVAFLRQHRFMRDLLGDHAEPVDFFGLKQMARHAEMFCSADRWFVTGMAASFVDPLFSSNTMTIAALNLLIESVIEADRAGKEDVVRTRVEHFNVFFRAFHEASLLAIDYRGHGSFDGWSPFRMAMLNNIVNRAAPEYYRDLRDLIAFADKNVGRAAPTDADLARMTEGGFSGAIRRLKDEYIAFLEKEGRYYDRNRGQFLEGTERVSARRHLWDDFSETVLPDRAEEDLISYEALVRHYASGMAEIRGVRWNEEAFQETFVRDIRSAQTVSDIVTAMVARRDRPHRNTNGAGNPWSPKGPPTPHDVGWVRV
jgi:flavin-dependent dehydrogenase